MVMWSGCPAPIPMMDSFRMLRCPRMDWRMNQAGLISALVFLPTGSADSLVDALPFKGNEMG